MKSMVAIFLLALPIGGTAQKAAEITVNADHDIQ